MRSFWKHIKSFERFNALIAILSVRSILRTISKWPRQILWMNWIVKHFNYNHFLSEKLNTKRQIRNDWWKYQMQNNEIISKHPLLKTDTFSELIEMSGCGFLSLLTRFFFHFSAPFGIISIIILVTQISPHICLGAFSHFLWHLILFFNRL